MTINKVCGSGMKAAMLGGQSIKLGEATIVVAAGMESMSRAPFMLANARTGYRLGNETLVDSLIKDGLWDPYGDCHMGTCSDLTAISENLSRKELDDFAAESYRRALDAAKAGLFEEEISPIEVKQRKGPPILVDQDEEPSRGDVSKLSNLRPAYDPAGRTTAGNASSLNDGACALLLASKEYCDRMAAKPLARLVGWTTFAQDPALFTTAPAFAIEKLFSQHRISVEDVDLFEINEAFSTVALAVSKRVNIPLSKMNIQGGAVALGHPIGMSGARLILTAALQLHRLGGRYAIASPCIGGGESTAILIENLAS